MGLYAFSNTVLIGFFAFAALYHAVLWVGWRKERLFLAFALRSAVAGLVGLLVFQLATTIDIATTQRLLGYRISIVSIGLIAGAWALALLSEVKARAYLWTVTVVFLTVVLINTFFVSLAPEVTGIQRVLLPWGEPISIASRAPGGWWVIPLFLLDISIDVFGLYCSFRLWRRDHAGGLLVGIGVAASLVTTVIGAAANVFGQTFIYVGLTPTFFWTVAIALQIVRRNRLTETQLAAQEERHRLVLEEIRDHAIYSLDPNGLVSGWNLGATRVKGYTAAEILGRPYSTFFTPEDVAAGTPDRLLASATRDGHVKIEGWSLRRDGSRFWASGSVTAIRDSAGIMQGFAGVARDMTDLKRLESLWRSVVDTTIEGIVTIDERGEIQSVNPAAEAIFGHTAAQLIRQSVKKVIPGLDSGQAGYLTRFLVMRHGTTGIAEQIEGLRSNGERFPLELAASGWSFGERQYFTLIVRNISGRVDLELQLRQSQKMEAVGRLAGGVAHDFNNILTVINGYAALLLSEEASEDTMNIARQIRDASGRATALTAQLLTLSRKSMSQLTVVNLNTVVTESAQMLKRIIGEDVELVINLGPDTYQLKADRNQLGQVVLNLALNARDAMPRGGTLFIATAPRVIDEEFAAAHPDLNPGPCLVLKVSDTGEGMTPEVMGHIFEPFFTTKGPGSGTGLGLSVVHGIVAQTGGYIEVKSAPGTGTTFEIFFPAIEFAEPPKPPAPPEKPVPGGTETVLVVEDDAEVLNLVLRMLRTLGYTLLQASNMQDALRIYSENQSRIDAVLTDVIMPQGDGPQLARALREIRPDLPVLFMSGYAPEVVRNRGVLEGVQVILKPFTMEDLAERIRGCLTPS